MSFEEVLEIFKDHLEINKDTEVFKGDHGYCVLFWDYVAKNYTTCDFCRTPKELFDALLDTVESYYIINMLTLILI